MTAIIYTSELSEAIPYNYQTVVADNIPENMLDGLTYSKWSADVIGLLSTRVSFDTGINGKVIDSFAFDVHNLVDCNVLSVRLDGSNDVNFVLGVETIAVLSTVQNGANVVHGNNTTNFRYYKFELPVAGGFTVNPIIGIFYAGLRLELPEGIKPGYTPPKYGIKAEILNNKSVGSNFIGRSLKRSQYEFTIKNANIDPAWIEANWHDLIEYIQLNPFFYLWNDTQSGDVVYCWTDGKITPATYQDSCFMRFSFKCSGYM